MTLTSIDICSAALVKLGAASISSFDEETTEADVANTLYEVTRDGLLGLHPWSFALDYADLPIAKMPAADGFDTAFGLPGDLLKSISVSGASGGHLPYQIKNGVLHLAGGDVARLHYIKRPDEGDFPSYFVSALVNRLAAEFCLPLTENAARSELLFKLADAELSLAKLIDSHQDTPPRVEDFTLIGRTSL